MAKEYKIAPEVLARAKELGIYGEHAEARLKNMAKFAARFTHPEANHRFRQYIMFIEADGEVSMFDIMDKDEAAYFNSRTYEERIAESRAEAGTDEATVEYKDGKKR